MGTEILQVRDVPSEDARALRARAASQHVSLSRYLRELIHDDASLPPMSELMGRIASREHIEVGRDDIRSFIDNGRR